MASNTLPPPPPPRIIRPRPLTAPSIRRAHNSLYLIVNPQETLSELENDLKILEKDFYKLQSKIRRHKKKIEFLKVKITHKQLRIIWGQQGRIAIEKYAQFHGKSKRLVSIVDVVNSSAGVCGWAKYIHPH